MRKFLLVFIITIISLGLCVIDAQSKRFGGGKSFGYNRSASSFSRPTNSSSLNPSSLASKPASGMSKWLGPLAGLAAGGLLASLFMGHGLGTGILSWILLAGGIFLIWSFIRGKLQSQARPMHQQAAFQAQPAYNASPTPFTPRVEEATSINAHPDGFDESEFLRHAKSLFIRLQAAFDQKNLADLREFTAPEVFSEIKLQLQERGDAENITDVVSIDAKLLDLAIESRSMLASVRFSGMIREEQNSPAQAFEEIWHFRQDQSQSHWAVVGIQQE